MGCDIHAYIEYRPDYDGEKWKAFVLSMGQEYTEEMDKRHREDYDRQGYSFFAHPHFGRNYGIFAYMAGVRNYYGAKAVVEGRGVPRDASWNTARDYTLYVDPNPDGEDEEGCTSLERAEEWVSRGYSEWWDEEHNRVVGPDWHTASWMSTDELEEAYKRYLAHPWDDSEDAGIHSAEAIIAAMKALPNARLVFWFDN